MKRDLVKQIVNAKKGIGEPGLRVTLSRIKNRHDLRSIQQAACFYVKKHGLPINVSSIIDDVTRKAIEPHSPAGRARVASSAPKKAKPIAVPKLRWVDTRFYSLAARLADFYPYLFIFENALRTSISSVMSLQDVGWWDSKIRNDLLDTYNYAAAEMARQSKLPMVGTSAGMAPLDYLTVGHLEGIIVRYPKHFIPSFFPTLNFFQGHMVIVKRVRNAMAHMAPSTTVRDIRNAKNEMDILLQHMSTL